MAIAKRVGKLDICPKDAQRWARDSMVHAIFAIFGDIQLDYVQKATKEKAKDTITERTILDGMEDGTIKERAKETKKAKMAKVHTASSMVKTILGA